MSRNTFIIILAIILPIIIVILFWVDLNQPTKEEDTASETQTTTENKAMETAVMGLYNGYSECMKNPPAEATGMVSNYCQANSAYTSTDFVKNITANPIPVDPITCSQNPPLTTRVSATNPSEMNAEVIENFGGDINTVIKVGMVKQDNEWKVDNIICSAP